MPIEPYAVIKYLKGAEDIASYLIAHIHRDLALSIGSSSPLSLRQTTKDLVVRGGREPIKAMPCVTVTEHEEGFAETFSAAAWHTESKHLHRSGTFPLRSRRMIEDFQELIHD